MSNKYRDDLEFMDVNEDSIDQNEGGNVRLSAEEIAAVLADTYFSDGIVGEEETVDDENVRRAENERDVRRRKRMREMRRRKKQQECMRRLLIPCAVVFVICVFLVGKGIGGLIRRQGNKQNVKQTETVDSDMSYDSSLNVAGCYIDSTIAERINDGIVQIRTRFVQTLGGKSHEPPLKATADEKTALPNNEVVSENGIFIDVEAGKILGQKDAGSRISPASMTKILTVLVAAEHITDPDDFFEITQDITDYSYVNKCSITGFDVGEKVTVRDLFYGTILPSGADAALGLAVYVSGSQDAFVELMNEKLDELGLSRTSHFTNCVGLYDENHYSTVYDMAVILKAACDNSFCREVLSAHTYTTSATERHPEGITISNWFLRRIEDKDTHGEVLCAKTGFVVQSGNCAASLSIGNDGKEYICVTAHSTSTWRCIYDHVALYQQFLTG